MPAVSSSPISPALGQLQNLPAADRTVLAGYLAQVPDPRDPRGVRHTLASLLLAAVAAMLAGARSFTEISEWAMPGIEQIRSRNPRKGSITCSIRLVSSPIAAVCWSIRSRCTRARNP